MSARPTAHLPAARGVAPPNARRSSLSRTGVADVADGSAPDAGVLPAVAAETIYIGDSVCLASGSEGTAAAQWHVLNINSLTVDICERRARLLISGHALLSNLALFCARS